MSHLKLAEIPCEVEDKLENPHKMGMRVTNLLKRINFPGRDKIILSMENSWGTTIVKMYTEVTDTQNGAPISLSHQVSIKDNTSDEDIVKEIFIMLAQYVLHEFAETFRFDGAILFNPHDGERNEKSFQAIREMVKPIPPPVAQPLEFSYVVSYVSDSFEKPKEKKKEEKPKKEHAFAKFFKHKDWQDERRFKRGA